MTDRDHREIFSGQSIISAAGAGGHGGRVSRDGDDFYKIVNYHTMPPFLISVVSGYDHWMFVSSTGGLTCGRRDPGNALFPYCTDDKLHDASAMTGPRTVLLVERDGRTMLWQPFTAEAGVYDIERHLYKNVTGNKLIFEEHNRDLELTFSYMWTTGDCFGFIRKSELANTGAQEVRVEVLDGMRNLLPYGVDRAAQSELSTLVDAYKQAETVDGACAGIYTVSSILTDRAEPSEALRSTIVWSTGLQGAKVLLSEDQVQAFIRGKEIRPEASSRGKRGAFFVQTGLTVAARERLRWYLVADVEQGPAQTVGLLERVRNGVTEEIVQSDITEGTLRLGRLAGCADGFQKSADPLVSGRHFSNVLSNVMRGGVFPREYRFPADDFLRFVEERNRPLCEAVRAALEGLSGELDLGRAVSVAEESENPDFIRLVYEYLPLTFSRRHGDPSRPWNHFSIELRNGDGTESLTYQGNWRDIFQNWEALARSFPEYIESFIAKFVNASTADGYNPYRISRRGIDWEVLDPGNSWSNIGYWGDHQVCYLLRFLELSRDYHPGLLANWLTREIFVYANVPYRIKPYEDLIRDPRNTVEYDDERARAAARRVAEVGSDGDLLQLADGSVCRANLLEKLLVSALARIGNLVPDGGIWMNTQRPEWNDANNALVGYGLSMVTLSYLRRFLCVLRDLLQESSASSFRVSVELARFFTGAATVISTHANLLGGPVSAASRKSFMDAMGSVADRYRTQVYRGLCGDTATIESDDVKEFMAAVQGFLDHSITNSRREDGLYHSYNLVQFGADGYGVEHLDEMLEGQVAVLSSGHLDAAESADLLEALERSRLYREDQNSYVLYPDRKLPSFLEKNVIPAPLLENARVGQHLSSGCTKYLERDVNGRWHFNGSFRNVFELRRALEADAAVSADLAAELYAVYEAVFEHKRFTGRSISMYKYEGLGCIYWHMVSKLLVAAGQAVQKAVAGGVSGAVTDRLRACFREIQDGIGVHKQPIAYGAFPTDPYSHTPGFAGVQQPGLTGQVKEDVITRFLQLGVHVAGGQVAFEPVVLGQEEFLQQAKEWTYSVGGPVIREELPSRSLAFTLCGVPVIYRIGESAQVEIFGENGDSTVLQGNSLGFEYSQSLFRRNKRIRKLVVDLPAHALG